MKKFLAVITMLFVVTPIAVAKPGSPPLKREQAKYTKLYNAVRAKYGKRAPGRQILKQGVRHKQMVRAATAKEVAASIRELRAILHPYLVAKPPKQPPAGTYTASAGPTLERIAQCESGGNPRAVSPTGQYRGKYQFDYGTWASVGGHGDPAAASVSEQDMRAAILYQRSGPSPWPVCGFK